MKEGRKVICNYSTRKTEKLAKSTVEQKKVALIWGINSSKKVAGQLPSSHNK
jgi:hypothetical protein